jgi:hypothetical protein
MKTQMLFLLIVACINVSLFIASNLTTTTGEPLIAGMGYTSPLNSSSTIADFESRINATSAFENWQDTQDSGYFNIGDVFSGLSQFWATFRFLIDGIPALFDYMGSFIPVASSGFTYVAWGFRILTGIMFVTLVIEFVSGRELMP